MMPMLYIILEQSMLHMPLIIGAYISFSLLKVPDLSIESAYVVGALCGACAVMGTAHMAIGIQLISVLCASLIGGALVGLTSSMLTQKGNFPHLLSCIVTFGLFHGFNQLIVPTYMSLHHVRNPLQLISITARYPELPILIMIGCVVIVLIYLLFRTQLGYAFAVYGNNPLFFRNYGISTSFIFVMGVALANALAGLSGYLFAQSNNFVELNMGLGKALSCITALILGKSLSDRKAPFSIVIPIIATSAYFTLQQALLKLGFNLTYFMAVQAFMVLCILLYTYHKHPRLSHDNLGV